MLFFKTLPKTIDQDMVEYVFSIFDEHYIELRKSINSIDYLPEIKGQVEHEAYLSKISKVFRLNNIHFETQLDNIKLDHSAVFKSIYWRQKDEDIFVCIRKVGSINPQITIVESLLFLSNYKIGHDGFIEFNENQDDLDDLFTAFSILFSIYIGFGVHLILRHWIKGYTDDDKVFRNGIEFTTPMEVNTMIYAYTLISCLETNSVKTEMPPFNSLIQKEIKTCKKYILSGKSNYFNKRK